MFGDKKEEFSNCRKFGIMYEKKRELKGLLLVTLLLLSAPLAIAMSLACGGSVVTGRRVIVFIFCVVIPAFVIAKDHRYAH